MTTENEPTLQSLAEGQQRLTALVTDFIGEQRKVNAELQQFNAEQRQFNERTDLRLQAIEGHIEEQRQFNAEQRQFNERTDLRLQAIEGHIEEQRQFNAEQRRFNERTDLRLQAIESHIEEQHQFNAEQRQFNAEQRQFNERTDLRLQAIEGHIEEQRQFNAEQRQFNAEQRQFNAEQRQFNERTETRLGTIQADIAEVKGGHARTETVRRADVIASALNLIYERTLSAGELEDMVRENPDIGVARNELESFTKADLVIKARDGSRFTNYVAVEISYTADQRDIDRAMRNADLLTRFTRRPAHAVVASVRNDSVVSNLVADGFINWYEIPLRDLQAA